MPSGNNILAAAMTKDQDRLLSFWFGGVARPEFADFRPAWFNGDAELDAVLRRDFLPLHIQAAAGRLNGWAETPQGLLALVLLLDQAPRNLFRGTARAFATDAQALALARAGVRAGLDAALSPLQRLFLYLPFEHSESFADQERAVALIAPLGHEQTSWHARHHHGIIARFGRFPHRNAVLGRATTPAEAEWLAGPEAIY